MLHFIFTVAYYVDVVYTGNVEIYVGIARISSMRREHTGQTQLPHNALCPQCFIQLVEYNSYERGANVVCSTVYVSMTF